MVKLFIKKFQEINYKANLIKFCQYFQEFINIIKMRQKKILISLTSYKNRFDFLPNVIKSLREQSITSGKIVLLLTKEDMENYRFKIDGIDIIAVKNDLRPHKKYYYNMLKYPEYAIVTVDDDVIYCQNIFKRLYDSYIEHPNLFSGRSGNLMMFKKIMN
jgi:hypothetical protein